MAEKYISMVVNTLHKCMMSRKNTVKVASTRPTPRLNRNSVKSGYTASTTVGCSGAPVKIITIISATKLNTQFTSAKHTFSSGKMYLGMYTFLMSGAAPSMLDMALVVASLKKVNSS